MPSCKHCKRIAGLRSCAYDIGNSELQEETHLLDMAKKIFLMIGGLAVAEIPAELEQEQELLADLADMMIQYLCFGKRAAAHRENCVID